jgi:hypothetical protein
VSSRLGLQAYSLGLYPGTLAPADGRFVEVAAHFHACMLCDSAPRLTLEAVERRQGRRRRPAKPGVEVEAVEIGTGDRRFQLRALEAEGLPVCYELTYRVEDSEGHSNRLRDTIGIARRPEDVSPPAFWVPVPPDRWPVER